MITFLRILSKLALVVCGVFIGAMCAYGFDWATLIGAIASILMHYIYILQIGRYNREHSHFKIRQLKLGDPKPEEMPDEIWNQLQGLLQYTADEEGDDEE